MKKNIFLSLEFDNMNPIQKIEMLSSDLNTQILDEIIIILHALNEEFTTLFKIKLIYYLDDNSIYYVAKNIFGLSEREVKEYLIILEKCNLIYRFTCAKKFKLEDDKIKQLRINSWGEHYFYKYCDDKYKDVKEFIKKEIESRYCLYKELVDNVSNINNYDTSENIKKLNKESLNLRKLLL